MNIVFLHSPFVYTQVLLEYLRHLLIVIFSSICLYVRFSLKKKKKIHTLDFKYSSERHRTVGIKIGFNKNTHKF